MDGFAAFRGFPCTLSRCPMGGRHGADNVVGGLSAAAPQGGYGLVSALPLAGGTKKMACWGAASVGSKRARSATRGCGMALLHCDAVAGTICLFGPYLARVRHPLTPSP